MIVLRVLGFLWSLPLSLIGLAAVLLFLPRGGVRVLGGVLEVRVRWLFTGRKGHRTLATTLGHVMLHVDADPSDIRRHEREHTAQGDAWGVFWIPAYGVACIIAALSGGHWYFDSYFERKAREAAR